MGAMVSGRTRSWWRVLALALVAGGCDEAGTRAGERFGSFLQRMELIVVAVGVLAGTAVLWLLWQWIAVARGRRRASGGLVMMGAMVLGLSLALLVARCRAVG